MEELVLLIEPSEQAKQKEESRHIEGGFAVLESHVAARACDSHYCMSHVSW